MSRKRIFGTAILAAADRSLRQEMRSGCCAALAEKLAL